MTNLIIPIFSHKIESVQQNAVLAITGTIRGTSKEKLYQELGLESSRNRRWLRRMSHLYKIILTKSPPYLNELIPPLQKSHRYPGCFKTLRCRTELFRNSFLSLMMMMLILLILLMNGLNWTLILRTVILMEFSAKNLWLL